MSEAMTPAGLAYLTMPFSGSSSMMPMLFWRRASRRMPSTLPRRPGSRLPIPLSCDAHLGEAGGGGFVGGRPRHRLAEAIDRGLVESVDGLHRGPAAREQGVHQLGFFGRNESCHVAFEGSSG